MSILNSHYSPIDVSDYVVISRPFLFIQLYVFSITLFQISFFSVQSRKTPRLCHLFTFSDTRAAFSRPSWSSSVLASTASSRPTFRLISSQRWDLQCCIFRKYSRTSLQGALISHAKYADVARKSPKLHENCIACFTSKLCRRRHSHCNCVVVSCSSCDAASVSLCFVFVAFAGAASRCDVWR